jgi:putative flippase GtrA
MDISKIMHNKRLIRYFVMAVCIVLVELATFQVVYLITNQLYMVATVVSFVTGVLLNWVIGRKVVFGASHHHPTKEFLMVLVASLVGLGLQLGVVFGSVTLLHLYPLIGKVLSILISFFWNYWFRAAIIYRSHKPLDIEDIEESIV